MNSSNNVKEKIPDFSIIYTRDKLIQTSPYKNIKAYQEKKLRIVLENAAKTEYWKDLQINDINLDNFSTKVPVTNKDTLRQHEKELLPPGVPLEELIQMFSSGSTDNPTKFYHTRKGMPMEGFAIIQRQNEFYGANAHDKTFWVFPEESPIWNLKPASQMYFQNLTFIDPRDLIKDISQLEGVKIVLSYAHNFPNILMSSNQEDVKKYTKDLIVWQGLGDYTTIEEEEYIEQITGAKATNPLTSIENFFPTMKCPHNEHHVVSDKYIAEIDDKNRLILTFLGPDQGTHALRFYGGDLAEWVDCNCDWTWPSLKILGREKWYELTKHFNLKDLFGSVFASKALKSGQISYDLGAEKRGKTFDVYIKKGPNYKEDKSVTNEIRQGFFNKNLPMSVMADKNVNYELEFKLVDEIPERLRSQLGKFKTSL